ncbi:unnamed protein product [Bubo scandiacus]
MAHAFVSRRVIFAFSSPDVKQTHGVRRYLSWIDSSITLQPLQRQLSSKILGAHFYRGESHTAGWLAISNQAVNMTENIFCLCSSSHPIKKTP